MDEGQLAALNWATKRKIIAGNPIRGLTVPPARSRGAEAVVRIEDWDRLLGEVTDSYFRDYLTALKFTGARPSEVAKVTAADFDPVGGTWSLADHKTAKTGYNRIVVLVPEVVALSSQLALKHPTGPLFRNRWGNPWQNCRVVARLIRINRRLGTHVTAYSFRHTFATSLLQAGMPDHDVATLLGHQGTAMLHKHYAHLLNNTQRLREALSAHLPRSSVQPPTESPKDGNQAGGPPGQTGPEKEK